MRRLSLATISLLIHIVLAASVVADTPVSASWTDAPPAIDGTVTPGEWNGATATTMTHAQVRTMNDGSYLYVLLDVIDDTFDEGPPLDPSLNGDFFTIAVDADRNSAITPNVDLAYSTCQDGRLFVKSYYIGGGAFTSCQNVDSESLSARGFGASFNSATAHRVWEFRLKFAEIGVDPSTWGSSGGATARVRANVGLNSGTPAFSGGEPSSALYPDLTNTYVINLALGPTTPVYPPGTDGPVFAGVGLVPSTYIESSGHASINIPGYYSAADAPFGGRLNVFGHWDSLRALPGAKKYRVVYSKDGGPFTRLLQTFTNFKFVGGTWVPQSISPDSADAYPIPPAGEIWYLSNLLIAWQSNQFSDGTYELRLEILNNGGVVLPSPAGNSVTLAIYNTAPFVKINSISYDDGNPMTSDTVCACSIVTQGDAPHGFRFNVTVTDGNGALNAWSLAAAYGENQSTGAVGSDNYAANVNADGPNQWNGDAAFTVPMTPFRATRSCAYTWILAASSRVQNGYGLVFPHVSYHVSLTTLLGTGSGEIMSCAP